MAYSTRRICKPMLIFLSIVLSVSVAANIQLYIEYRTAISMLSEMQFKAMVGRTALVSDSNIINKGLRKKEDIAKDVLKDLFEKFSVEEIAEIKEAYDILDKMEKEEKEKDE